MAMSEMPLSAFESAFGGGRGADGDAGSFQDRPTMESSNSIVHVSETGGKQFGCGDVAAEKRESRAHRSGPDAASSGQDNAVIPHFLTGGGRGSAGVKKGSRSEYIDSFRDNSKKAGGDFLNSCAQCPASSKRKEESMGTLNSTGRMAHVEGRAEGTFTLGESFGLFADGRDTRQQGCSFLMTESERADDRLKGRYSSASRSRDDSFISKRGGHSTLIGGSFCTNDERRCYEETTVPRHRAQTTTWDSIIGGRANDVDDLLEDDHDRMSRPQMPHLQSEIQAALVYDSLKDALGGHGKGRGVLQSSLEYACDKGGVGKSKGKERHNVMGPGEHMVARLKNEHDSLNDFTWMSNNSKPPELQMELLEQVANYHRNQTHQEIQEMAHQRKQLASENVPKVLEGQEPNREASAVASESADGKPAIVLKPLAQPMEESRSVKRKGSFRRRLQEGGRIFLSGFGVGKDPVQPLVAANFTGMVPSAVGASNAAFGKPSRAWEVSREQGRQKSKKVGILPGPMSMLRKPSGKSPSPLRRGQGPLDEVDVLLNEFG